MRLAIHVSPALIRLEWRSHTGAQATSNRRPCLARAIVPNEAVTLGSCEELILHFSLVQGAKGYPTTQSPCGLVERRVAPAWLRCAEIGSDGIHVPFGAPPRAGVARDAEAEMNNRFARRRRRRERDKRPTWSSRSTTCVSWA